jgi:hypothetical protein
MHSQYGLLHLSSTSGEGLEATQAESKTTNKVADRRMRNLSMRRLLEPFV